MGTRFQSLQNQLISDGLQMQPLSFSNNGQRIFGGRMAFMNLGASTTFQITATLSQHFDAVRIIFANQSNSLSYQVRDLAVSAISSTADLNNSAGTWQAHDSYKPFHIPIAPTSSRIAYELSDWIPIKSVARTDGGTLPLLVVRALFSANSALPVYGNGTDDFTNWATKPNGRIWVSRQQAGNFSSSPTGFTSTTNTSQSPIVGIQYAARGKVVNVMIVGDSIYEGRGTYLNEGFVMPVCNSLSDITKVAIEYSNCAWSTTQSPAFMNRALDILDSDIKPDVIVFPSGSPNDGTPYTSSIILANEGLRGKVMAECTKNKVTPILCTVLPTNSSVNAYGSSDALRVADNQQLMATASNPYNYFFDASSVLNGTTDGTGQVQILAGTTTDGIHPNDTGNGLLSTAITPIIKKAIGL